MPIPAGADTFLFPSPYSDTPLVDDFSYKLNNTGIILNPNSITMPFVDITKVQGLDSAPYRTTERDHEGTDGGFMDAEFEKGRSILLEGIAYADGYEVETYLDALKANFAPSRVLIPFYFKKPGVTERFIKVKPLGCRYDVEQIRRLGYTDIQFSMFAEDPRIYSSNVREEFITQSQTALTGRSYNKSYSYGYGTTVDPSARNVVVGGNRLTPVTLTMTGPAVQPTVINESLGTTMVFDLTLDEGSTLTVDTYYHTVKVDGANRRAALVDPNWFYLSPGDNIIRYRSQIDGGSILTVRGYDAWR